MDTALFCSVFSYSVLSLMLGERGVPQCTSPEGKKENLENAVFSRFPGGKL